MIAYPEMNAEQTEERFRALFQDLLTSDDNNKWSDVEIVYSSATTSQNFSDVSFLMAHDERGNSYLYSANRNGNSVYSITAAGGLKLNKGKNKRAPRLRLR